VAVLAASGLRAAWGADSLVDGGWSFIWVTSANDWQVTQGRAEVTIKDGHLTAELVASNERHYRLEGNIRGNRVQAKLTNRESDFFVASRMTGTFRTTSHRDMNPCGQELLHLGDGLNFLGLKAIGLSTALQVMPRAARATSVQIVV